MEKMWLINWEDDSYIAKSFEEAVSFVEKELESQELKDSAIIVFDAQDWGCNYKGREYKYPYIFNGKPYIGSISINEVDCV